MKKAHIFLGISILIIAVILVSGKIILAQPVAKKICLYPKYEASEDVKISDLKAGDAICFDDAETLRIFNSSKTSILKFTISQGGGYIGTFTDKQNKVHLIRVISANGIILDGPKTYTVEDAEMQAKWYEIVHAAMLQQRKSLK